MGESALLEVCGIAFAIVFSLLGIMALVMYLITVTFPDVEKAEEPKLLTAPEPQVDVAVVAAIATAVATMMPGARVTSVQEDRS